MNKYSYAAFALCAFASSAFASQKCDQETTQGTWAYTCEGTLPTPAQTPTRLLGRCSASRSGFWDCEGTANLGSQILPQVLHGQAFTHPNCTGKISYTQTVGGAPAGTLDINYVIHSKGDALSGLPTNTGGVLSCSLHRIGNAPD